MSRIARFAIVVCFCLCALPCVAGEKKPKAPPIVPDALKAQAWRANTLHLIAQAQVQAAQTQLANARAELEKVAAELTALCGGEEKLQWDAQDIRCRPEVNKK